MEKKLSSYQKLKKKTAELQSELLELALRPESIKSHEIRARITFESRLEKQFWSGSPASNGNGILNQIP